MFAILVGARSCPSLAVGINDDGPHFGFRLRTPNEVGDRQSAWRSRLTFEEPLQDQCGVMLLIVGTIHESDGPLAAFLLEQLDRLLVGT